ncbi:hypothetical protein ADU86_03825 [Clostridium botulinum]|uniref:hypothetical protein n=1 Tax=Clostridium botulinum TaxID=1491 RepID=UPI0006A3F57F|nr:hypothetical protein [Clostridium botulinum]KOC47736.1 hypothetical protein ADU86_03825 [Clostridium botulinum]
MILRIEFKNTEINAWNKKHNADEYSTKFEEEIFNIVDSLIDITNEYWDSHTTWYDKIYNVKFDLLENIDNDTLETIKDKITSNMEIDIEKIEIDTNNYQ